MTGIPYGGTLTKRKKGGETLLFNRAKPQAYRTATVTF